MFKQFFNFKTSRGFTLIELAIVLGVIGLVLGGLWATVSAVWEKTRQEKLYEEIFTIVKNVRSYYAGQAGISGSFPALSTSLGNAGVFPGDMRRTAGCTNGGAQCFDHPWATTALATPEGSFTICPWTVAGVVCGAGPSPLFSIHLRDIPSEACINAVTKNSGTAAQPGLVDVVINGVSMVAAGGRLPPAVSLVRTNCAAVTTTPALDFVYRIIPPTN
ncbi:MAG: type 4 pilus major pilin [Alphaproteobacteria bacterium]